MSLADERDNLTAAKGAPLHRRSLLRALAVAALAAPLLSACGGSGFQPLYGATGFGAAANEKFARVQVETIPGRVGQRIRNELLFQITGGDERTATPAYRLEITTKEVTTSTLVQTNGQSSDQIYQLDAEFKLVSLADKKIILQGTSFGRAPFVHFDSLFSNVRAARDAEDRAAKTVATDIRARVSAALATGA